MNEQVANLLSLETLENRQIWIQAHYPQTDETLVQLLREESYQSERANPHTALKIAQALADLARSWQDQPTAAVALLIEANARRLLAEHTQAVALYEQARSIYQTVGLVLDAARAVVGLLDALLYLGRYPEALTTADWAIQQFRAANDQMALAKMIVNRANVYARLGRYYEAQRDYIEARIIFAALDDQQAIAMCEANEANVLINLNDFRQAASMFTQARARFAAADMPYALAQIDHNLAYLYFAQGDYQRALRVFNDARAVFITQESQVDVAYVDLYRSEIYLALNLWREALELARTARRVFAAANMQWEAAQLWLNEAAALAHTGDFAQVFTALNSARQSFSQENNNLWLAVTDLYQATYELRNQQFTAARVSAQRARQTFSEALLSSRVGQCEAILGEIALAEQNWEAASQHFAQGLVWLKDADLPAIAYLCHYGLGRVHKRRGQFPEARLHLEQAIWAVERLQAAIGAEDYKIAFRSDKLALYEELILLCITEGTPEAEQLAFATIERAKARALLDTLARKSAAPSGSIAEVDLLAEMQNLKRELNWYYNKLNTPDATNDTHTREQVAYLTTAITQREQSLAQLLNRWRAPDLASAPHNPIGIVHPTQIQATLPKKTLLIEFYVTQDEVIVFGISTETMWHERIPLDRTFLVDLLAQFRFQINKFGFGAAYRQRHSTILRQGVNACLQRLYAALLQPLSNRLTTAEILVIIPHDLLHYVPFHALFDGEHYLIQKKAITYAPSATILQHVLASNPPVTIESPLIFGIADTTIPFAQAEAAAVAALFPDAHLRIGEQATVDSFLHSHRHAAFLHISTHATFRSDNPTFSALKLADGWVTVNDIYEMDGLAPLVTLSACETGRNHVQVGDELLGLCRGFFSTGVHSLVVSQWAVDDDSTAQLMGYFYQALQQGRPVYQALQIAQQMSMQTYDHPYYWAPFLLMGNPWTQLSPALII